MVRRFFPIMHDELVRGIPWPLIEPHEAQARRNHDQSLDRLAQRGGLSVCEAVAVLEDRPWVPIAEDVARGTLLRLVANYLATRAGVPDTHLNDTTLRNALAKGIEITYTDGSKETLTAQDPDPLKGSVAEFMAGQQITQIQFGARPRKRKK